MDVSLPLSAGAPTQPATLSSGFSYSSANSGGGSGSTSGLGGGVGGIGRASAAVAAMPLSSSTHSAADCVALARDLANDFLRPPAAGAAAGTAVDWSPSSSNAQLLQSLAGSPYYMQTTYAGSGAPAAAATHANVHPNGSLSLSAFLRFWDAASLTSSSSSSSLNSGSGSSSSSDGQAALGSLSVGFVTSYLVCLVAKLLSLDMPADIRLSLPEMVDMILSQKPLPDEQGADAPKAAFQTTMMQDSHSTKAIDEFRLSLINTIYFIAMFCNYDTKSNPLRASFQRWTSRRGHAKASGKTEFESQVFKLLMASGLWESEEALGELINICSNVVPTTQAPVAALSASATSLSSGSSAHGQNTTSGRRTPSVFTNFAFTGAVQHHPALSDPKQLGLSVMHGYLKRRLMQGQMTSFCLRHLLWRLERTYAEPERAEVHLLPLLTLFRELISVSPYVEPEILTSAYSVIHPFYMWPKPFSDYAKRCLDFVQREIRSPGHQVRQQLQRDNQEFLFEGEVDAFDAHAQCHVLVDMQCARAANFVEMLNWRPSYSSSDLKRMLVLRTYQSFFGTTCDLASLRGALDCIETDALDSAFVQTMQAMDDALHLEEDEANLHTTDLLNDIQSSILSQAADVGFAPVVPPSPTQQAGPTDTSSLLLMSPPPMRFACYPFTSETVCVGAQDPCFPLSNMPLASSFQALFAIVDRVSKDSLLNTTLDDQKRRIARVAIAGTDASISNVTRAYVALRHAKPDLMAKLAVQFFIVPLGDTRETDTHFARALAHADGWYERYVYVLTHAALRVFPTLRPSAHGMYYCGNGYYGVADNVPISTAPSSWANLNTMFAANPNATIGLPSLLQLDSASPSWLLRDALETYVREGQAALDVHLFVADVWMLQTSEGKDKVVNRSIPFFQRVELGSSVFMRESMQSISTASTSSTSFASGSSSTSSAAELRSSLALGALSDSLPPLGSNVGTGTLSRQPSRSVKFAPPEVSCKISEISLEGVVAQARALPTRAYWSIVVSNVPRAGDRCSTPNPRTGALEVMLVDADVGKKLFKKGTTSTSSIKLEGLALHAAMLELEAKQSRAFTLQIDDQLLQNVTRVRISQCNEPTWVDPSAPAPADSAFGDGNPSVPSESDIVLPVMTFATFEV
ncbi:hypothetical protein CAOG_08646 [Capsaspora owczarzaki ATCC 30864]|uniref:Uncharacterized protein n=1 Tax=Capsaspora owczarzaki (strain ATCC 30864) TaxID=595528 RepID=A0A0D2VNF1_CAPO3|nr:hypothetical protein CAOG_08646 [Capsaspora owczarzaki ATCC 30864]KJE91842.1 hypothetical protein CAOG_008646 [Capsaspora owczarzaki ATCC 30864]|eukprot:XP_011270257.1 hypothetical protein CAOG_08646 [Capsaspora owczarzaki ATCC 30864]